MTHEELLDRMTVEEFRRWFVLDQLEPIGDHGEWLRAGLICATMANINRGKDTAAFTPQDFMPTSFSPTKKETPKSMKEKWTAIMHAQNALVDARMRSHGAEGPGAV